MPNFYSRLQNYVTISTVLIIASFFLSCGPDSNKANLLDPIVKYRSDTMFAHRRILIINEMDSLCILREDGLLSEMIDSLYQRDKKKVDAIVNRTSN